MNAKALVGLLKETAKEWSEDKSSRLAAALAYYTIFSLAPLLIIVIAIAGLVFGQDAAQGEIVGQLQGLLGRDAAQAIQTVLANAGKKSSGGIITTILNVGILIFGASGVFAQLQDAMNTVWEVAPKPGQGIKQVIRTRLLSFSMILVIGFLLLVSLALSAGLAVVGNLMGNLLPGLGFLWQLLNFAISFGVITLLFAMIFKILPDAKIAWGDVWLGAGLTALLFAIGKLLIGLYLGNASVGSAYGAAGSLVVLLIWVYYSAQIMFFGAEFTQVYASHYGSRIVPADHAVALTDQDRAQEGRPRTEDVKSRARQDSRTSRNHTGADSSFLGRLRRRFSYQPQRRRRR